MTPHSPSRVIGVAVLLFVLSLSVCLEFVAVYPLPEVMNDAAEYLTLARNVAAGRGFTMDGATPAAYRPPLFPTLLGGWYRITGTTSPNSAAVFQAILLAVGTLAAFLLFLDITASLAWAAGAALFLAVNPLLVTRVAFVLQEPTILLFTTLAVWVSVRFLKTPSIPRAALAGAAWGVCTLVKTVAGFAPFLLLTVRLLPGRRGEGWRGDIAVMLLCFAAAVFPWTARNYVHFQRFIPVNAQGEGMLEWNVSHAEIPGERPGAEFAAEVYRKGLPEGERKKLLWRYVLDRPAYFFGSRILRNAVRFVNPPRDWWWARGRYGPGEGRPWYWTAYDFLHRFLFLCLMYRTVQAVRGRHSAASSFVVLFGCAYWAVYALSWGDGRYALPIYPVLVAASLPWGVRGR